MGVTPIGSRNRRNLFPRHSSYAEIQNRHHHMMSLVSCLGERFRSYYHTAATFRRRLDYWCAGSPDQVRLVHCPAALAADPNHPHLARPLEWAWAPRHRRKLRSTLDLQRATYEVPRTRPTRRRCRAAPTQSTEAAPGHAPVGCPGVASLRDTWYRYLREDASGT